MSWKPILKSYLTHRTKEGRQEGDSEARRTSGSVGAAIDAKVDTILAFWHLLHNSYLRVFYLKKLNIKIVDCTLDIGGNGGVMWVMVG
jgi:hypothetical protein